MHHLLVSLLLVTLVLLGGCGPTKPEIVRPVVVPEKAGEALLKTIALQQEGNLLQAEVNLEVITMVRPDIPEAHLNLGWVKHQLGKFEEAITHLQNGIELAPGNVQAYNLLGICQRETGQFTDAESTYIKALELAPDYDRLHLNLGILYDLYLFQPQPALKHYRRYQSLQQEEDKKVAGWIVDLERREARQ